jgi:hypothetical protein
MELHVLSPSAYEKVAFRMQPVFMYACIITALLFLRRCDDESGTLFGCSVLRRLIQTMCCAPLHCRTTYLCVSDADEIIDTRTLQVWTPYKLPRSTDLPSYNNIAPCIAVTYVTIARRNMCCLVTAVNT